MKNIKLRNSIVYLFPIVLMACSSGYENQKLVEAGFDHIQVGGELKTRLNRNFDRLEEEYYHPANVFWTEEESNGWPGDKEGRTILGLVMDARATGRTPKYLDEIMSMLPSHLNAKGYMGTIHANYIDEQQLSGNGWVLRGLNEYYEWCKDEKALEISKMIVDSLFIPITPYIKDYPISSEERNRGITEIGAIQNTIGNWAVSSDVGCIFIAMDGIIHAYKNAPNPGAKKLVNELISLFLKLDLLKLEAQTHASLTGMRGLIRYAEISGNTSLITEVEHRWDLYKAYGMTENYENYNWFGRYNSWTEPCAIVDSYLLAVQLWKNTGKTKYLEDAEKIYWNGMAMTQRANGGFGLDSCVGPASNNIGVSAYEAYWCCTMRGGEGLARAAQYSYFIHGDQIIIPFYRESSLNFKDKNINITQDTQYPFDNRITFTFNKVPNKEISLLLFVPDYMLIEKLTINGNLMKPVIMNSFLTVKSNFKEGTQIVMEYALDTRWVDPHSKDIKNQTLKKAMFGPLILSYKGNKPITIETEATILQTQEKKFAIEGTDFKLEPLYHLLDPRVSDKTGYKREVLFDIQISKKQLSYRRKE